jgi:hypothetical protein
MIYLYNNLSRKRTRRYKEKNTFFKEVVHVGMGRTFIQGDVIKP